MKKHKIPLIRLLFSAAVSAVLFYVVMRYVFSYFWNFDLLSERHWKHILEKWQSGWVVKKPKEICFFAALFFLIPGYLGTWFIVYVFPLKKILLFPKTYLDNRKKSKLQAQSLAAALGPANKQETLAAKKEHEKTIKVSSEKLQQIDHLRGKGTPVTQTHAGNNASPAKTAPANEAATRFDLWEKLSNDLETKDIFVLRQMKIRAVPVNLIAMTQESIFLLFEGPEKGNTWEINENASPAVWKTENGDIPSPLRLMLEAKKSLQDYFAKEQAEYSGLNINCCMILDHGNIVNTDVLLKHLEEWDMSVLRMGSCKTTTLPDTNALIEYIKSQPVSSQTLNDAIAVAILDLMETDNGE